MTTFVLIRCGEIGDALHPTLKDGARGRLRQLA
jgi:hypothetical protein